MGWGEQRVTTSAEHVRRISERIAADNLAIAVRAFTKSATTGDQEQMVLALASYTDARTAP